MSQPQDALKSNLPVIMIRSWEVGGLRNPQTVFRELLNRSFRIWVLLPHREISEFWCYCISTCYVRAMSIVCSGMDRLFGFNSRQAGNGGRYFNKRSFLCQTSIWLAAAGSSFTATSRHQLLHSEDPLSFHVIIVTDLSVKKEEINL